LASWSPWQPGSSMASTGRSSQQVHCAPWSPD
jgi:hypothetical protein